MLTTLIKSDYELRNDVLAELRYEPSVKVPDICVLAKDGVVTLNGFVNSYSEKWYAVRAVKRVSGMNGITEDIEVRLPESQSRADAEIAATAARQLDGITDIPKGIVNVTVREGWITLEGEVEWWFLKDMAENALHHLSGVKGVTNRIAIQPKLASTQIQTSIEWAFARNALLDADRIQVVTSGSKVKLRGEVRNLTEREEAERAAWAAAGVFSVENHLTVNWA